jgi:hypothetical protein
VNRFWTFVFASKSISVYITGGRGEARQQMLFLMLAVTVDIEMVMIQFVVRSDEAI